MASGDYVVGRDINFQYSTASKDSEASPASVPASSDGTGAKKKAKKRPKRKNGAEAESKTSVATMDSPDTPRKLASLPDKLNSTTKGKKQIKRTASSIIGGNSHSNEHESGSASGRNKPGSHGTPKRETKPARLTSASARGGKTPTKTGTAKSADPEEVAKQIPGLKGSKVKRKSDSKSRSLLASSGQRAGRHDSEYHDKLAAQLESHTASKEELGGASEFWNQLNPEERSDLASLDKDTLLYLIRKEINNCSCSICADSKQNALDEKLEELYSINEDQLVDFAETLLEKDTLHLGSGMTHDIRAYFTDSIGIDSNEIDIDQLCYHHIYTDFIDSSDEEGGELDLTGELSAKAYIGNTRKKDLLPPAAAIAAAKSVLDALSPEAVSAVSAFAAAAADVASASVSPQIASEAKAFAVAAVAKASPSDPHHEEEQPTFKPALITSGSYKPVKFQRRTNDTNLSLTLRPSPNKFHHPVALANAILKLQEQGSELAPPEENLPRIKQLEALYSLMLSAIPKTDDEEPYMFFSETEELTKIWEEMAELYDIEPIVPKMSISDIYTWTNLESGHPSAVAKDEEDPTKALNKLMQFASFYETLKMYIDDEYAEHKVFFQTLSSDLITRHPKLIYDLFIECVNDVGENRASNLLKLLGKITGPESEPQPANSTPAKLANYYQNVQGEEQPEASLDGRAAASPTVSPGSRQDGDSTTIESSHDSGAADDSEDQIGHSEISGKILRSSENDNNLNDEQEIIFDLAPNGSEGEDEIKSVDNDYDFSEEEADEYGSDSLEGDIDLQKEDANRLLKGAWYIHSLYGRIFEQRILKLYREKVAKQHQESLLAELVEEESRAEAESQRKQREKDKKKSKKLAAKQQKEEEDQRKALEAKKKAEKAEAARQKEAARRLQQLEMNKAKQEAHRKRIEERMAQLAIGNDVKNNSSSSADPALSYLSNAGSSDSTTPATASSKPPTVAPSSASPKARIKTKVTEKAKPEMNDKPWPSQDVAEDMKSENSISDRARSNMQHSDYAEGPQLQNNSISMQQKVAHPLLPPSHLLVKQQSTSERNVEDTPPIDRAVPESVKSNALANNSLPRGTNPLSPANSMYDVSGLPSNLGDMHLSSKMSPGWSARTGPSPLMPPNSIPGMPDNGSANGMAASRGIAPFPANIMGDSVGYNTGPYAGFNMQPAVDNRFDRNIGMNSNLGSFNNGAPRGAPLNATGMPHNNTPFGSDSDGMRMHHMQQPQYPSQGDPLLMMSNSQQPVPEHASQPMQNVPSAFSSNLWFAQASPTPQASSINWSLSPWNDNRASRPLTSNNSNSAMPPGASPWATPPASSSRSTSVTEILEAAKQSYPEVKQLGVDGFVPSQLLYHAAQAKSGLKFSQSELYKACSQLPSIQCLRDDVGLITHIKM